MINLVGSSIKYITCPLLLQLPYQLRSFDLYQSVVECLNLQKSVELILRDRPSGLSLHTIRFGKLLTIDDTRPLRHQRRQIPKRPTRHQIQQLYPRSRFLDDPIPIFHRDQRIQSVRHNGLGLINILFRHHQQRTQFRLQFPRHRCLCLFQRLDTSQ